jgi:hypothetical protein
LVASEGKLTAAENGGDLFRVIDRGQGRVAFASADDEGGKLVTVADDGNVTVEPGEPTDTTTFQWIDLQRGDLMLMSLTTNRYLRVGADEPSVVTATAIGPRPDRRGGACFHWEIVGEQ